MASGRSLRIDPESKLHKKLIKMISSRISLADRGHAKRHTKWQEAEETTVAYVPETEADIARRGNRDRGLPVYTTIKLPYSYAILMSAHTYWTSVFFSRSPVHQYAGRHGESEQQTQALEALISYQVEVGGMLPPYYVWLYDAGKYGAGIIGHYWDIHKVHYGEIVEMENIEKPGSGEMLLYQATHEIEGYRGNRSFTVCPYDFMHDPRVPLSQFQQGEFCCRKVRLGWHQIVQREDAGYYINTKELKEHVTGDRAASLGSSQLERPITEAWIYEDAPEGNNENKHPAMVVGWEFYWHLIPKECGLGDSSFPQKWCFTITEDKELIFGASPVNYIHGMFPFDVAEVEIEAYGLYNRGIPETMEPLQNTLDWLINSHFYNVRASINNQFILDPSKLVVKDASRAGPGFIWRLRPEAYGTDLRSMFLQVPVQDVTRTHLTDMQFVQGFGEKALGVNDSMMGMMQSGGRKTATEVRTSTGFGINRQKTTAEWISASAFSTHSQKLVQTSQQFYKAKTKLRIVGDLMLEAGQGFLNFSPEMIQGFYDFIPIDGTLPIDRMAQANLWKEMLGNVARMPPQVQMGYDWGRVFGWVAVLGGLKNINQFKIQLVPDEQLALDAQRGNVVPIRPNVPRLGPPSAVQPGNAASTAAGLPQLGQSEY